MHARWGLPFLVGAAILPWTSVEAGAQEPCPLRVRSRNDWGPSYEQPDTNFLLNTSLEPNDPSVRIGADGIHWVYHGKLLAVRWERTSLTRDELARFIAAHRARLRGALPDSVASRTTCVFSFPIAFRWEALDSVALIVRRWPGVLSAEPMRSGRWVPGSPMDSTRP